jgi:hypothetical protein
VVRLVQELGGTVNAFESEPRMDNIF